MTASAFAIQASEVNTGDFLDETATPSQLEISTAQVAFSRRFITFYATLPVPIHNDDVGEPTGQITVSLIEDDAASRTYRIATDGSQTATGTILDDDAPVLKISAGTNVTEGDGNTADFTISSDVLVYSLTVHYNLHTSNFLEFGSGTDTFARLNFSGNGPYTAPLNLTVHDDNVKEDDGLIGVTLIDESTPGTSYYVAAAPDDTAELTVLDNDVPPRISVAADNGSVAENTGPAMFTLSTTGLSADTTLMINATPVDVGGNFVANSSARNFSIMFTDPDNDNTYTGNLAVPLTTDQIGEPTGQIKLTLNTDTAQTTTYQLGTTTEGYITVFDDDAPELKVTAVTPVIYEGVNLTAGFKVSSEVRPTNNITVRYDLTESFDYIAVEGLEKTISLNLNNTDKEDTILIPIIDDQNTEDAGTITLTLLADNAPISYLIASAPDHTATITINDDESLPVISITADNGVVAENDGPASYMLTATGLSQDTTLTINATPSEFGLLLGGEVSVDYLPDDIVDIPTNYSVPFTDPDGDNIYQGEITIPIVDDDTQEFLFLNGNLKLTLNSDPVTPATYRLGTVSEGIVVAYDDEIPQYRLDAIAPKVVEAENATADFAVTSIASADRIVPVRYQVKPSSFVDSTLTGQGTDDNYQTAMLDFTGKSKTATLSIPITNDDTAEANGDLTVVLVASNLIPAAYAIGTIAENTAQVTIIDDDTPTTISIAATEW